MLAPPKLNGVPSSRRRGPERMTNPREELEAADDERAAPASTASTASAQAVRAPTMRAVYSRVKPRPLAWSLAVSRRPARRRPVRPRSSASSSVTSRTIDPLLASLNLIVTRAPVPASISLPERSDTTIVFFANAFSRSSRLLSFGIVTGEKCSRLPRRCQEQTRPDTPERDCIPLLDFPDRIAGSDRALGETRPIAADRLLHAAETDDTYPGGHGNSPRSSAQSPSAATASARRILIPDRPSSWV